MERFVYFEDTKDGRSGSVSASYDRQNSTTTSKKMDGPMSAYWVKFFKNAGFSSEVATKHAVVFSNNRIQPDMLPDLDKPSLKEMGITLMGDMIAILRYAKKVVEETSCEKIMISSEVSPSTSNKSNNNKISSSKCALPIVKAVPTKPLVKPAPITKVKYDSVKKIVKTTSNSTMKTVVPTKKIAQITQTSRMYSDYIDTKPRPKSIPVKRKYDSDEEEVGIDGKWVHNETIKRLKNSADNIDFKPVVSKRATAMRSQKILKKALEQKRPVFNRLGESMVSSTTNVDFSNANIGPTFTVTGVVKDVYKRNSSVFNRLGNKDYNLDLVNKNMRNGSNSKSTHGILKTRTPLLGTKVIAINSIDSLIKKVGTMRADEEAHKKAFVKPKNNTNLKINTLVKNNLTRNDSIRNNPIRNPTGKKSSIYGKLASDSVTLSAKSRLGTSKQVTFNKMSIISHNRKQGVFSRLGV